MLDNGAGWFVCHVYIDILYIHFLFVVLFELYFTQFVFLVRYKQTVVIGLWWFV